MLRDLEDLELLFRRMAYRSATGRNSVRVPQFPRLRQVAGDISRTPSGGRIREIYRQVNLWTDESVSRTILPGRGAAALLSACSSEASSLLELGYRREDGIDFITSLPDPGRNPVRPPTQIRSAMHHIGGDMDLLRELLERPEPGAPALKLVFSAWPLGGRLPDAWRPGESVVSMHVMVEASTVPLVVSFSRTLMGYAFLYLWDCACSLASESRTAGILHPSFEAFTGELAGLVT